MGQSDVIIVGAGFAGAATAFYLSQKTDLEIVLVEREETFGVHASGRNAAMLRQAVPDEKVGQWIQETLTFIKTPPVHWEVPNLFRQTGSMLTGTYQQLLSLKSQLEKLNVPGEIYAPSEFPKGTPEDLIQFLKSSSYQALLHTPSDGVVDIHSFLGQLLKDAKSRGVKVFYNSEVKKINWRENHWSVQTSGEKFSAKILINAAGAWINQIGGQAGQKAPEMIPFRRHLYFSESEAPVQEHWPLVWNVDQEIYFRPETGGILLSPGDEDPQEPGLPQMNPNILELLDKKLKNVFPSLQDLSITRGWACLRTKTATGRAYVTQDAENKNFFWVGALGGHGVGASMGVGKSISGEVRQHFKAFLGNGL